MANIHQIQINFSEGAYRELNRLARRSDREPGEVLRDGLGLEKFILDESEKGSRFFVEKKGKARQVLFD